MLGIKGSGDKEKLSVENKTKKIAQKRKTRRIALGIFALAVVILASLSFMKSSYAEFSKTKLQEFVKVWVPIENTNDQTIESDIQKLSSETIRIKSDIEQKQAPINSKKLKSEIIDFFVYADTFTTDMHNDFQWSKELSVISNEDDQAILSINFNEGIGPLQSTLEKAIATIDANVVKMDAMKVSKQVAESHKEFRDNVAEESSLYSKLLSAVKANDTIGLDDIGTEIKVFNEKFGKMSGPSSALTIAYAIKTKEFEIKIEKLGKEIDYASNILINNFY